MPRYTTIEAAICLSDEKHDISLEILHQAGIELSR